MTRRELGRYVLAMGAAVPCAIGGAEYDRRRRVVRRTKGLAAFWDFAARDEQGRFVAYTSTGKLDFALDAVNYVREYWHEGREASYADLPAVSGEGPFGNAVQFRREEDPNFRPVLLVPRSRLHDSPLDVKGPRRSVSMAAWVRRESGNHAIAGIWHEGTDLHASSKPAARVERGRRQYALFAGLAANSGASAVHVSENGSSSFSDRYARNLAVTPQLIREGEWTCVGFVFDNARNEVTAYWNGRADDFWIEKDLDRHPFFKWPALAWTRGHRRDDPSFPADQFYLPPEGRPEKVMVLESSQQVRVEVRTFRYTKVRVRMVRRPSGVWEADGPGELIALRGNPFWFPHDLYCPDGAGEGGPFTIGRVIHSSRGVGFTGLIGGVAVFDRALSRGEMRKLAEAIPLI